MALADRLRAWARQCDADLAMRERRRFEAATGRSKRSRVQRRSSLEVAALQRPPLPRPLLVHHVRFGGEIWGLMALGVLTCAPEVDTAVVLWDPPADDSEIERWLDGHEVSANVVALSGAPDGEVLGVADGRLPWTRLVDRDGAVLRTWAGPWTEADARDTIAILTSAHAGSQLTAAPTRSEGGT